MRQVLIDYARRRPKAEHVDIAEADIPDKKSKDLILLDEALTKLAKTDERKAAIVEYRYFIGLTIPEIREALRHRTKNSRTGLAIRSCLAEARNDRRLIPCFASLVCLCVAA